MRAALFIMLDDCLIRTRSRRKYPLHSEDWVINAQSFFALKKAVARKEKIIVISKQPAVAHGIIEERVYLRKVESILSTLERDLKVLPNSIVNLYSTDEESFNWIPKPGLVYEAVIDYELNLVNSTFIYGGEGGKELAAILPINSYNVLELNYEV